MSNFLFLTEKSEYALFSPACVEAEKIYASAPAMCAVGCRKAIVAQLSRQKSKIFIMN